MPGPCHQCIPLPCPAWPATVCAGEPEAAVCVQAGQGSGAAVPVVRLLGTFVRSSVRSSVRSAALQQHRCTPYLWSARRALPAAHATVPGFGCGGPRSPNNGRPASGCRGPCTRPSVHACPAGPAASLRRSSPPPLPRLQMHRRWDYVTLFGERCDMDSKKYGHDCALEVGGQVALPLARCGWCAPPAPPPPPPWYGHSFL